MNSENNLKCRLCLVKSEDSINIFSEIGERLKIVEIIRKHFWFDDIKEDDTFSNQICMICWKKVENFHFFYMKVFEIHNFLVTDNGDVDMNYSLFGDDFKDIKDTVDQNNDNLFISTITKDENEKELIDEFDSKNEIEHSDDNNSNDKDYDIESDENTDDDGDEDDEESLNDIKKEKTKVKRKTSIRKSTGKTKQESTIDREQRKAEDQQIKDYIKMDCELCQTSFNVFQDVKTHYRKIHMLNGFLKCCDKKFFKRVYVLEHIQYHLNPEAFKCHLCNKLYANKRCLVNHMDKHRPSEEKPYECTKCSKTFAKKFKLRQHMNIHIPESEKSFFCDECGKAFSTKHILQSHKKAVHDGAYVHICEVCAKMFKSKMFYEKHCKTAHSSTPLPKVQCQQCGVWLKHEHGLRSHMKRHEEANKLFICNICGKKSPTQSALSSHKRYVHISQRIHKCTFCAKSFKQAISLKEHMTVHTGAVLYTCPYCPKTFNSSANMHSHKKKIHVKEWAESKKKMFEQTTTE